MRNLRLLLPVLFLAILFFVSCSDIIDPQEEVQQNPDPENPDPQDPPPIDTVQIVNLGLKTIFFLESNSMEGYTRIRRIFYINGVKGWENTIATKSAGDIRQIEVDTTAKYIFWRSKDNLAIYRRKTDGSDAEKLIAHSSEPFGIDVHNKRIYYVSGGTLRSVNYNGDTPKDHLVEGAYLGLNTDLPGRYMYIDGAANRLYWIKKQPSSGVYYGDLNELEKAADYNQNIYFKAAIKITDIQNGLYNAVGLEKQGNYIYYAYTTTMYRNTLPGPSVSVSIASSGEQFNPPYFLDVLEKKVYYTSKTNALWDIFKKNVDGTGQPEKVNFGVDPKSVWMMVAF